MGVKCFVGDVFQINICVGFDEFDALFDDFRRVIIVVAAGDDNAVIGNDGEGIFDFKFELPKVFGFKSDADVVFPLA